MSEEKFTPGPWETSCSEEVQTTKKDSLPPDRKWGYGMNDGFICCLDDGEYHIYSDPEECKANANLIAAAPEMYAALKNAIEYLALFSDGTSREISLRGLEILKKARGEKC